MKSQGKVMNTEAYVVALGTAVGKCEHEGPLGGCFDFFDGKDRYGMDSWEKAESEMQRVAFSSALNKAALQPSDIDALFAGDLLNQCVGSAYGMMDFDIPYFGLYGACSTSAEGLILASLGISGGFFSRAAAVTSSHNCSAERQYRTPIEYGGQKPPTAQWTVTGAGAFILGTEGDICIKKVMPGIVIDGGITDPNNMGAAMAPAAADSLLRYFSATGESPRDYDMILTGDLGAFGAELLQKLTRDEGLDISAVHADCGMMIYKGLEHPDVNSGGSGCGCSATVLAGHVLPRMRRGELRRVLFLATGAMMSPSSIQQGLTIPAIAHAVRFEKGRS